MGEVMVAICGLDCSGCPLLKASQGDLEAAAHLADWWHNEGWLDENEGPTDVVAKGPHCAGCHGDRTTHWSANCWILKCAVDERGLDGCHECDNFPCDRLVEWAKQNEHYAEALERLHALRSKAA